MKYANIISKPDNDTAWMLQVIANELAEANRLTRLRLKPRIMTHGLPKEKLEDKAV